MKESTTNTEEKEWWERVGRIIGTNLLLKGWSGYNKAEFATISIIKIDGHLAGIILKQHEEIKSLKSLLEEYQ